ncbi:hypothetical protein KUCAC02_029673 [Chaenocephalus aceratus]|nr:hypothetical protein KUCAC02_029673 [Chaenocephalus aceratus]
MGIIVNEMDSLANIVQSCETSEATDEKKEVEEFPDLPKTEAGQRSKKSALLLNRIMSPLTGPQEKETITKN